MTGDPLEPGAPREVAVPALLEQEGGRLLSLASRFCGSPTEAEDLVQEVFLQAWRRWEQFEGRSRPGTWLYTIAARTCQRMHRKRSGEPDELESLDELLPFGATRMALVPSEDAGPLDEQVRREGLEQVERAIESLPPEFRMPLVLKELVGLAVDEVAQVLDLPTNTVKTRLHRARLKLRAAVESVLPQAEAVAPRYSREVCLDLLAAKQRCLDEGLPFTFPDGVVCERCESVFSTLDVAQDACRELAAGDLPKALRDEVLARLEDS